MIKFRYYTPDGQLIEQNNVPIVYDGNGIEREEIYYALSTTNQTAPDDSKFSLTVPTMTFTNKYLWSYTLTTYTNKTTSKTEKVVIGTYGDEGEQGATYLGAFDSAQTSSSHDGDYYLNKSDGYIYVYSRKKAMWEKLENYSDSRYQVAMNDMISIADSSSKPFMSVVNAWVKNLTAQTALINELFAKQISLRENGFIQSESFDDTTKNGFQIKANGDATFRGLKATNVDISGKITATKGDIAGEVSIGGFISQNNIQECILGWISFSYDESSNTRKILYSSNFADIFQIGTGQYVALLKDVYPLNVEAKQISGRVVYDIGIKIETVNATSRTHNNQVNNNNEIVDRLICRASQFHGFGRKEGITKPSTFDDLKYYSFEAGSFVNSNQDFISDGLPRIQKIDTWFSGYGNYWFFGFAFTDNNQDSFIEPTIAFLQIKAIKLK